jgi:succinate dehydrogenase/fumarate reductase flavoprotein subunit
MLPESVDAVVVGAGNAAMCAALAAAEQGASVLVLERAPQAERSGNTHFTAGAFRCAYDGVEQLRALMPDLTDDEVAYADLPMLEIIAAEPDGAIRASVERLFALGWPRTARRALPNRGGGA